MRLVRVVRYRARTHLRDQAREMEEAIYPRVGRQTTGARADRRQNSLRRQPAGA